MSIEGSPHARFRRTLEIGKLPMVLAAAAELPPLQLDDALEVLALMADQSPPERYRAAAARWCGRAARVAARAAAGLGRLRIAFPKHPEGLRVLPRLLTARAAPSRRPPRSE